MGAIICLPSHSVIPKSRLLTWASSASHQHPQDHPARLLTSPSYSHTGRHSRSSTGSCPCDFLPPRLVFLPSPSSYFSKFLWCAHSSWPHSGLQFHVSPSPPSLPPPSSSALSQLQGSVSPAQEQEHQPNRSPFPELLAKVFRVTLCCFWGPLLQITFEQV